MRVPGGIGWLSMRGSLPSTADLVIIQEVSAGARAAFCGPAFTRRLYIMPCATVHMLLADRVLTGWENDPSRAPVPVRRPEVRAAFLHGAVAPDMGFVPGVDRFVSELAHYCAPADLTRALLRSARTAEDEAFVWGWVTHVLGDVEIHPIVGRGVGEVLHGDRAIRVDADQNVAAHVSLEVGLDVYFHQMHPRVRFPPHNLRIDSARIVQMETALAEVYGLRWDRTTLIGQSRRALWLIGWWPWALRILATSSTHGGRSRGRLRTKFISGALGGLRALSRYGSAARGFLTPGIPKQWMVDEVGSAIDTFPTRFQELVELGLGTLPNQNLETGGPAGPGRDHTASDVVAARLTAFQRRGIVSYLPGTIVAG